MTRLPTVDVPISVDAETATLLADPQLRAAVGRLVERALRPLDQPTPLARAIADVKAEAREVGLTDADIDAELAAFKAERRLRA